MFQFKFGSLRTVRFGTYAEEQLYFLILKPLFDIWWLEDVSLSSLGEFNRSFLLELARAIASAWPNLTSLTLNLVNLRLIGKSGFYPFQSLVHLMHGCPKLMSLRMDLEIEDLPDLSTILPSSHALQSLLLVVPESFGVDCLQLARLVDRLFPNLQTSKLFPCSIVWVIHLTPVTWKRFH